MHEHIYVLVGKKIFLNFNKESLASLIVIFFFFFPTQVDGARRVGQAGATSAVIDSLTRASQSADSVIYSCAAISHLAAENSMCICICVCMYVCIYIYVCMYDLIHNLPFQISQTLALYYLAPYFGVVLF